MKKIISLLLSAAMSVSVIVPISVYASENITLKTSVDRYVVRNDNSKIQKYSDSAVVTTEWGSTTGAKVIFDLSKIEEKDGILAAYVSAQARGRQTNVDDCVSYLIPTVVSSDDASLEKMEADSDEEKFVSDTYNTIANNKEFTIPNMDISPDLIKKLNAGEEKAAYILRLGVSKNAGYDFPGKDRFTLEIVYMDEANLSSMKKKEVTRYMDYYLAETSEYAEFLKLSDKGKEAVINLVYEERNKISNKEVFADALNFCIEKYYAGADFEIEDINEFTVHYGAAEKSNVTAYNSLSETGKETVTQKLMAADRTNISSADDVDALFGTLIGEYYINGETDSSDVQLTAKINGDVSIYKNTDVSLEGLANGIAFAAEGKTLDLSKLKITANGEDVNFSLEGQTVKITDSILPETVYTVRWTGIADGIYDSCFTFTTTGVYVRLGAGLLKDSFKEKETIEYTGTTAEFSSGRINKIEADLIDVSTEKNDVVKYEKGIFTAVKRGIEKVTFKKDNEGDHPSVSAKRMMSVYSTKSEGTLDSETNSFTSNEKSDTTSVIYNAGGAASFKITVGENTFDINTEEKGEHQIFVNLKDGKLNLYRDGELTESKDCKSKFTSVSVNDVTGDVQFKSVELMDVYGTVCTAEWVTLRNVNNQLIGEYKYTDPDEDDKDSEQGTVYKWYLCSGSSKSLIQNENGKTLSNASKYGGNSVVFEVTPANAHEQGMPAVSEPLAIEKTRNSSGGNDRGGSTGNKGISKGSSDPIVTIAKNTEKENNQQSETKAFNDVTDSHWAYSEIKALTDKGILKGYGDGSFKPSGEVTRAEFLCALLKALGINPTEYNGGFSDVSSDNWYSGYVSAAVAKGYISGFEDGTFGADRQITREQMAVILQKALNAVNTTKISFTDSESISPWAAEAVIKVCADGIMNGKDDGSFAPQANATRAEMAAILYRIINR